MSALALTTAPRAPLLLCAQAPDSAAVADSATAAVARATSLFQTRQRDSLIIALGLLRQSADQFDRVGNRAGAAEATGSAGSVLNQLSHPDSALGYFDKALAMHGTDGNRAGVAAMLSERGEALWELGYADSAIVSFRQSLLIARDLNDSTEIGYGLHNLGTAFQRIGRPDSALGNLRQAIVVRERIGDTLGLGASLNNLSTAYQTLGRHDSSVVVLHRALALRRAAGNRAGEGTTLNNLGYAYEFIDRDSALAYYRAALPVLEQAGRRSTAAITYGNMGRVFLSQGAVDSARRDLARSIDLSRETGNRAAESWAANDLGRLHHQLGQSDSAMTWYALALRLERDIGDRRREGETLQNIAQHYHRRSTPDVVRAVAYYDSAAAARSEVGGYAGGDVNRVSFLEQDTRLYEEWALAWLARPGGVDSPTAGWAALAVSERGKAQALLELIRAAQRRSVRDSSAPPPGFAPGQDLAREGRELARASGSAKWTLAWLTTQDTLLTWLASDAGRVIVHRQQTSRDSLRGLVLAAREALKVDTPGEVGTRSAATASSGASPPLTAPRTNSLRELQALRAVVLAAELEDHLRAGDEIVLVPQGMLTLVPFAALPATELTLGLRHALRFTPSLGLLAVTAARPPGRGGRPVIVGNPSMPRIVTTSGDTVLLAPLPQAAVEARAVARRLGTPALIGARASEAAVRTGLPSAPIVHLATHGVAYATEVRARASFVALAPGGGQDGFLTVAELLDDPGLTLKADLVVLSACQTGLGDLKDAEGTVGLQRAFLARGARSVLVSQWSVSDVATAKLMEAFYRHWRPGRGAPSRAEALRMAQVEVAETPGLSHPRFWAGFQLVGAN